MDKAPSEYKDTDHTEKDQPVADSGNRSRTTIYLDENSEQIQNVSHPIVKEVGINEENNSKNTHRIDNCICNSNISRCSHEIYIRHVAANVNGSRTVIACPLAFYKENNYLNKNEARETNAKNGVENIYCTPRGITHSENENPPSSPSKHSTTNNKNPEEKSIHKNEISQHNPNFRDVGINATYNCNNQDISRNICACTRDYHINQKTNNTNSSVRYADNEQPSTSHYKPNKSRAAIEAQASGSKVVLLYCSPVNDANENSNTQLHSNCKCSTCNITTNTQHYQDDADGSKRHQSMVDTHNRENIRRNQSSQYQNERIICPSPAATENEEPSNILISRQHPYNATVAKTYSNLITNRSDFILLSHENQNKMISEIIIPQVTLDNVSVQTKSTQTRGSTSVSETQMHETRPTKVFPDSSHPRKQKIKLSDDHPLESKVSEKSDLQIIKSSDSNLKTTWHPESQNQSNHPRVKYFSQNLENETAIENTEFTQNEKICTKTVKILYEPNPDECESVADIRCYDDKDRDPNANGENGTDCIKKFSYQRLPMITKCLSKVSQISNNENKK